MLFCVKFGLGPDFDILVRKMIFGQYSGIWSKFGCAQSKRSKFGCCPPRDAKDVKHNHVKARQQQLDASESFPRRSWPVLLVTRSCAGGAARASASGAVSAGPGAKACEAGSRLRGATGETRNDGLNTVCLNKKEQRACRH